MFFDFLFEYLSYGLVRAWVEVIGQNHLFAVREHWIVQNGWVQIEQNRQVDLLARVKELVFETEALDLIEVECTLFWKDLVDGDAGERLG